MELSSSAMRLAGLALFFTSFFRFMTRFGTWPDARIAFAPTLWLMHGGMMINKVELYARMSLSP
jgi:hypothetical protein